MATIATNILMIVPPAGGYRNSWRYYEFRFAITLLTIGALTPITLLVLAPTPHSSLLGTFQILALVGLVGGFILLYKYGVPARKREKDITACAELLDQFTVDEVGHKIRSNDPAKFPETILLRLQELMRPGTSSSDYPWLTREWVDAQFEKRQDVVGRGDIAS